MHLLALTAPKPSPLGKVLSGAKRMRAVCSSVLYMVRRNGCAPSSVTAYAVPPSPKGKAFGEAKFCNS